MPQKELPSLKERYLNFVVPEMMRLFNYKNIMEVPRIQKVVVNMGVGEAVQDAKEIDSAKRDLALITGQMPMVCKARKSISAFKLRKGMPIGCKVTLRGDRMWHFLQKLFAIVLPRVRDFKGLTQKMDGQGNLSFGLEEQTIFPEVEIDKVDKVRGMNITIVTNAKSDVEARTMLRLLGCPFREE
ncbi:50S ribosomal protein L5 [bacterium]|nr:50S ribosomal protein L5 [bacterium]